MPGMTPAIHKRLRRAHTKLLGQNCWYGKGKRAPGNESKHHPEALSLFCGIAPPVVPVRSDILPRDRSRSKGKPRTTGNSAVTLSHTRALRTAPSLTWWLHQTESEISLTYSPVAEASAPPSHLTGVSSLAADAEDKTPD